MIQSLNHRAIHPGRWESGVFCTSVSNWNQKCDKVHPFSEHVGDLPAEFVPRATIRAEKSGPRWTGYDGQFHLSAMIGFVFAKKQFRRR